MVLNGGNVLEDLSYLTFWCKPKGLEKMSVACWLLLRNVAVHSFQKGLQFVHSRHIAGSIWNKISYIGLQFG